MDAPKPRQPLIVTTDPLKHFSRERWWVKLLALGICQVKYIVPSLVAVGSFGKAIGWW